MGRAQGAFSMANNPPEVSDAEFLERLANLGHDWRWSNEYIGLVVRTRYPVMREYSTRSKRAMSLNRIPKERTEETTVVQPVGVPERRSGRAVSTRSGGISGRTARVLMTGPNLERGDTARRFESLAGSERIERLPRQPDPKSAIGAAGQGISRVPCAARRKAEES